MEIILFPSPCPLIRNTQILTTGTATAILITKPSLRTPHWRNVKAGAFVVFGASAFVPLLHGTHRYGLAHMLQYSGMKWYVIELGTYGAGVVVYAVSVPFQIS